MKILIVYSSLTGNTRKVAEAIHEQLGQEAELFSVEQAPQAEGYNLVALGFWVDRGTADKKAQDYLTGLRNQNVALFATLGAYPDSEHAAKSMANAAALLDGSNTLAGSFICQGKVNPKLIEQFKNLPEDHPHGMNAERRARHLEAAKHPDAADLAKAQAVFGEIKLKLQGPAL
jgi:flavodoxin